MDRWHAMQLWWIWSIEKQNLSNMVHELTLCDMRPIPGMVVGASVHMVVSSCFLMAVL